MSDAGLPLEHLSLGQLVEVEVTTEPGEYAPIVVPQRIRIIGEAPLPVLKPVTYEQMASGSDDSQFVEISGTVRSVQQIQDPSQLNMIKMSSGSGRLTVYARQLPVAQSESLIVSIVRARGVSSTQFNLQRQLFAVWLMVPQVEDLVVESPAPEQPFDMATRTIGTLLQFRKLASGRPVEPISVTPGGVVMADDFHFLPSSARPIAFAVSLMINHILQCRLPICPSASNGFSIDRNIFC